MSRPLDTGPRPDCPNCESSNVRKDGTSKYGDQVWRCSDCGRHFGYERKVRGVKSGVIAGKIEIGRGMKWGAGW